MKNHQQYTENLIHTLTTYRFNLLKLVKFRQNSLAVLYIKYQKNMTPKMCEMCDQIIETDINYHNMNLVELLIEDIHHQVSNNSLSRNDMEADFDRILHLSEREYNNVTQAYYSFYSHGFKMLNR
ncbi:hypothetical protein FACS1894218_2730 [Bacilli bacterium]|nr:hypothetical protein FACS1894218_2730 [Bacilli bacterium]